MQIQFETSHVRMQVNAMSKPSPLPTKLLNYYRHPRAPKAKLNGRSTGQLWKQCKVGEHCAFAIESEAEPWVVGKLRRKVWQQGDSDVTMFGKRGEPVKSGGEYFTVQKLDPGYGDSGFQCLEVDGDEGILIVPAKNLIARKIALALPSMSRSEKEAVIGPEEYGDMDRAACSALFRSTHSHLPQRERERIWGLCPQ